MSFYEFLRINFLELYHLIFRVLRELYTQYMLSIMYDVISLLKRLKGSTRFLLFRFLLELLISIVDLIYLNDRK